MKIALILAAMLSTSHLCAWEVPGNPDRYISFGFNVTDTSLNGSFTEIDQPSSVLTRAFHGREKLTAESVGGDVRVPLTRSITASLSYDQINTDRTFTREGGVYRETSDLDGHRLGFGIRLYLNK